MFLLFRCCQSIYIVCLYSIIFKITNEIWLQLNNQIKIVIADAFW